MKRTFKDEDGRSWSLGDVHRGHVIGGRIHVSKKSGERVVVTDWDYPAEISRARDQFNRGETE